MSCSVENDRDKLIHCLKQQVSELELLMSMYPDDIRFTNKEVLEHINNVINSKTDYMPSHLDFVINLLINDLKLELCVILPSYYPEEKPDVRLRCNQMNRHQETKINIELLEFLKNVEGICLYTAISWLQENLDNLNTQELLVDTKDSPDSKVLEKFVRLWIFSHHIYNKKKREEIVTTARNLKLTGFCLPGKPAVICVEGPDSDCKAWWQDIKAMTWKKIMIRKTEIFDISDQVVHQKFSKFEEIYFQNSSTKHAVHTDMSEFSKYMTEHGLAEAFTEFFGLSNDITY